MFSKNKRLTNTSSLKMKNENIQKFHETGPRASIGINDAKTQNQRPKKLAKKSTPLSRKNKNAKYKLKELILVKPG